MKYIHIIIFLITHDLTELKEYWRVEFIKSEKFSWRKIITRIRRYNQDNFYFWWRLANNMHKNGTKKQVRVASNIQKIIKRDYNTEICLGATIKTGLCIAHFCGIVVNENVFIGKNFTILQNCVIGTSKDDIQIIIGDNVFMGANSVIVGGRVEIGNNVKIGAMSFVNKNIPSNCTVYTEKTNRIITKKTVI